MEMNGLKGMKMTTIKALCATLALGLASACGGGGGGGSDQPVNSKYSGVTAKASITTANAVAFTSDAFAAGSIGSSANVVGVVAKTDSGAAGHQTTLPEIATLVQSSLTSAMEQKGATPPVVAGASASTTIYGAAGGSASASLDLDQSTGSFSGKMTFSNYAQMTSGPTISGTVTMTGVYNQTSDSYDSLTMAFSPLSATTASGTASLYGTFAFSTQGTGETLRMSCTLHLDPGKTYWIKDWTYNFSSGNSLTVTGVYYHPLYGYVDISTPTPLTATSLCGVPTSGVFQAAGAHCSKAKLTFNASGSLVTAIGGDDQNWEVCSD